MQKASVAELHLTRSQDRAALILAGGAAFAGGIAALFGWLIRSQVLTHVHPSFIPISMNSAVAFVGAGCAFFFAGAGHHRSGAWLGLAACAYGAVSPQPEQSSLSVRLAFCAVGAGFAAVGFLSGLARLRTLGWAGSLAASLAAAAAVSYLWGVGRFADWAPHALMSVHEAAIFLAVGVALIRTGWKRENPNLPIVLVLCLGMFVASQIHLALNYAERKINQKNFESDAHDRTLALAAAVESDPSIGPAELLERALGRLAPSAADVYILEAADGDSARVIGYLGSRRRTASERPLNAEEVRRYQGLRLAEEIGPDGSEREIVYIYRPELDPGRKPWLPWAASGSITGFALLLAYFLWAAIHRARIVSDLVQQRTAELEKANQTLEEEIRQRRVAETKFDEQKRFLEKANAELDSFVYTASHDLRAPLRAIASFAAFLKEDCGAQLDARGQDHLEEIRKGALRMNQLIDDLLTLSRISRVRNPFAPASVGDMVRDVLERIRFDVQSAGARIVAAPDLPVILCDRVKLTEVFLNLITNAVKFSSKNAVENGMTPSGEAPQVEIGWKDRGDRWEFWVKDNGIGIEPKYHDQIFGIFKRLHPSESYEGTGVGLSIVKRVVDDHGGRVWVESEAGKGSVFRVILPKVPGVRVP
jgi:signal transduction histidine kinase